MNTEEKAYLDLVASLGCIVCGRPAAIHHPRFAAGLSQRASHYLAFPLCSDHHQTGGHGVAIHAGQTTFERMYGSEERLLAETIQKVFNKLRG